MSDSVQDRRARSFGRRHSEVSLSSTFRKLSWAHPTAARKRFVPYISAASASKVTVTYERFSPMVPVASCCGPAGWKSPTGCVLGRFAYIPGAATTRPRSPSPTNSLALCGRFGNTTPSSSHTRKPPKRATTCKSRNDSDHLPSDENYRSTGCVLGRFAYIPGAATTRPRSPSPTNSALLPTSAHRSDRREGKPSAHWGIKARAHDWLLARDFHFGQEGSGAFAPTPLHTQAGDTTARLTYRCQRRRAHPEGWNKPSIRGPIFNA